MRSYPKYKPSGVDWLGEIPSNWDYTDLKRVIRFAYGDSLSDDNRNGGDIPVYGSNGIIGFHDKAITKTPCIIVGRKGSYGKINYSEKVCFPIDTSYFIDSTQTKCNLRWLMYFLSILRLDENTLDDTVPGLSREWVYKMPILIPSISEQQQIADFLDYKTEQCDRFITNRQKQIELLNEQKASIINKAVTKGINPNAKMKASGIDLIGDVPEHWEIVKLKYVANNLNRQRIPIEEKLRREMVKKEYDYYGATGVIDKVEDYLFDETTILIAEDGANLLSRNLQLVFIATGKYWVNNHAHILTPKKNCELEFLAFRLENFEYSQLLRGAAQPKLTKEDLMNIVFPFPEKLEQKYILDFIKKETSVIETLISKYQKQIDLMQEYRTALISQAVTGKIDVREWKSKTKEKTS